MNITKTQRRWLRRIRDNKRWHEGPGNYLTLSILIRNGLVTQSKNGRSLKLTPLGHKVLLQKTPPQKTAPLLVDANTIYYWAYGSNLNVAAMRERCPGAKKLQALSIEGALVFRGVADVVARAGSTVHGGLWLINRKHEATLDAYEGVRSGLYSKCYLKLLVNGKEVQCLYYQMKSSGIYPPSDFYIDCIAQGYRDFGLPLEALDRALQETWGNKRPTPHLVERHARRGGTLARNVSC